MGNLTAAFTDMINTGYETMIIVMIILAVRLILKKIHVPGKYICLLWVIPFLHILFPFQIESNFSFMPKEVPAVIVEMRKEADSISEAETSEDRMMKDEEEYVRTEVPESVKTAQNVNGISENISFSNMILQVSTVLWITGMGAAALYSLISYIRFRRQLDAAICIDRNDNIYIADRIHSPFVLCGKKMAIYLPSDLKEEMKQYVLAHEKEHIRRKDPIMKLIAYIGCLIHWMNPFVWLAYYFLGQDMELACDEAVIAGKDIGYRKAYATTLLFLSVGKMKWSAVPLAFAEGDPKNRVEKIASYKRPAFLTVVFGAVCVLLLAAGLLSEPKKQDQDVTVENGIEDMEIPESYFKRTDLQPVIANINLKASTGKNGTKLYYVDEDMIIFGGSYGVFVFSKEEEELLASLNLEKLGWLENVEAIEEAYDIAASEDGKYIYFWKIDNSRAYAYDWKENAIYSFDPNSEEVRIFKNISEDGIASSFENEGKTVYFRLTESTSDMIGDLTYRESVEDRDTEMIISYKVRHLFWENRYKDIQAFEPEDLKPIVKAEMIIQGEVRTVTDENIITWLEENLSGAEYIKGGTACPFADPLYITRKDGIVGVIYPATDSCTMFRTENNNYYDYSTDLKDNTEFWSYFENWLQEMYPDIYNK